MDFRMLVVTVWILPIICRCHGNVVKSRNAEYMYAVKRNGIDNNCDGGFQCDEALECIETSKVCDTNIDCPSGSDERGCYGCPDDHFRCKSGECIAMKEVCDKGFFRDCTDKSDEAGCTQYRSKKRKSEPESLKRTGKKTYVDDFRAKKTQQMYKSKHISQGFERKRKEQQIARLIKELRTQGTRLDN